MVHVIWWVYQSVCNTYFRVQQTLLECILNTTNILSVTEGIINYVDAGLDVKLYT